MKTIHYFCFLLTIFIFSCESSSNNSEPAIEENLTNVSYGNDPLQKFDLYLPANRNSETKTIILVHGGGWIEGDKADIANLVPMIKQYLPGYAVANINYRLASSGNPAFPMQIDDIKSVIAKLKNSDYQISNDFGFIGASAGAHLSLLYSYAYDPNNKIKMVCSFVGPTNFADPNYQNNPTFVSLMESVIGTTYEENPNLYESLSPLARATASSPPTLLFYGNADPLVPTTQGNDLHERLNELGVYNEFTLYNGGHGDWSQPDQLDAYTKLIAFIQNKF